MPHRSPKAIPNKPLQWGISRIANFEAPDITQAQYYEAWRKYLTESKNNSILHLDQYTNAAFCHGTTQAFDHFYMRHRNRRFRFFKGEFMYHQASLKHGFDWAWLDTETLTFNDAVIISVPFSDSGDLPLHFNQILELCDYYHIPVLIDLAYLPQSKNITIDLSYKCIDTVTASISKAHDGAQYLRAGIRFQRENLDDGIDIANSAGMINVYAMRTTVWLLNKYDLDYNWRTYGDLYYEVCKRLVIKPTNCLMFGLSYENYSEFNRGNPWHRVCISEDIAKLKNENTDK